MIGDGVNLLMVLDDWIDNTSDVKGVYKKAQNQLLDDEFTKTSNKDIKDKLKHQNHKETQIEKENGVWFEFNSKEFQISSTIKDYKHQQLTNILLGSDMAKGFNLKEIEFCFQDYSLNGYMDLLLANTNENVIHLFEMKSEITDFGGTIRQINKYKKYFDNGVDKTFNEFISYEIILYLVLPITSENIKITIQNLLAFQASNINFFVFINVEKGITYKFSKKELTQKILKKLE